MSINRIHIRYEDDLFNRHRPFSMGVTIKSIKLGNATTHWQFDTPYSMQFKRIANKHVNKEFDIVQLRVYVNTMSEMLIPTSLLEHTMNHPL